MKAKTIIGAILLIFGFLMYQTGISIALEQTPYTLDFLKSFIEFLGINLKTDRAILTIEYIGGLVAIAGFLICISELSSKEIITVTPSAEKKGDGILEGGLLGGGLFSSKPTLKCKYCGAYIDENDAFCSKCNRALK